MNLPLKQYPDPVLKKKCVEVQEVTEEIKKIGKNMMETMIVNQGIGLAAPQVGILKRVIVLYSSGQMPEIFINPKIIKKSKKTLTEEEGCLCFPNLFLKVKRAVEVEIEALNEKGKKIFLKKEGLPARIFQHEIDHLDGILFVDRLSFWRKLKLKLKKR